MNQYFTPIIVLSLLWYVADRYERSQHKKTNTSPMPEPEIVKEDHETRDERKDPAAHGPTGPDVMYAKAIGLNPTWPLN